MLPAETRYPIHHKEMLAIVCALKEWRHYLHGAQFKIKVLTDHKSLVHFNTQPKFSERQARWNEFMAEFGSDIDIEYQEGPKNVVADALSRRADHAASFNNSDPNDTRESDLSTISTVTTTVLDQIIAGYSKDDFVKQILKDNVSALKTRSVKVRFKIKDQCTLL